MSEESILNELDEEVELGLGDELNNLLRRMRQIKNERDEVRTREKDLTKMLENLNTRAVALFEARDLKNIRSDIFGLAYKMTKVLPSVHDSERLIEWLDDRGEGAIAKRVVHPQTMISWINERLANGEEVPDAEIVSLFERTTIAFRK